MGLYSLPDDDNAINESATITYTASGGNFEGVTVDLPVTVTDNDTPTLNMSNSSASEGQDMVFYVTLMAIADENVTVQYTTSDGTAGTPSDYQSASGTLTFAPGSKLETITVSAMPDDQSETDETFTLTLSNPSTNAKLADNATSLDSIGTIIGDEGRGILISPWHLSVDKSGYAAYEISLKTQPTATVTVRPRGPGKFTPYSIRFTPSNWNIPRTVIVHGSSLRYGGDIIARVDHVVSGGDYTNIAVSEITLNIVGDNPLLLSVENRSLSHGEGSRNALFVVSLSRRDARDVTVEYRTEDKYGSVGEIYEAVSGTLTIEAGRHSNWFTVPILDNNIYREAGVFYILFENLSTNAEFSATSDPVLVERVNVSDNDSKPTAIILRTNIHTIRESGGPTTVTVTASTVNGVAFNHDRIIEISVHRSDPSSPMSFDPVPVFDIVIPKNQPSYQGTFTVEVDNDDVRTGNEVIMIEGRDVNEYPIQVQSAKLLLIDDDVPGVTIVPTTVSVAGDGTATYTVSLDAKPSADVTITPNSTVYGLGADNALTFLASGDAWSTPQTVTIAGRSNISGHRAITHGVSGGNYVGITIDDVVVVDDAMPIIIADGVEAYESDDEVVVTVSLTRAHNTEDIEFSYRTQSGAAGLGIAEPDRDYMSMSGTLTFVAGEVNRAITIPLSPDDDQYEEQESFSLVLGQVSANAGFVGGSSIQSLTVPVIIHDNDSAPSRIAVSVDCNLYPASPCHYIRERDGVQQAWVSATVEGGTTFGNDVQVSIDIGFDRTVTVSPEAPFVITIRAGEYSAQKLIYMIIHDDDTGSSNGKITVSGSTAQQGVSVSPTTIIIIDNDIQVL